MENVVKNIFWCLIVWLKMLFSYKLRQTHGSTLRQHHLPNNTKNQNHTEHQNTNKTQKKKIIFRSNRDRGRRIGAATAAIRDDESGFAIDGAISRRREIAIDASRDREIAISVEGDLATARSSRRSGCEVRSLVRRIVRRIGALGVTISRVVFCFFSPSLCVLQATEFI